ncbi:MAG: SH3 domain-containing protein, partial [Acidobacteriota bacterium]
MPLLGQESEPVLGAPAALSTENPASDRLWLEPGTRLHSRPDLHAPTVARVDAETEVDVLERQGHWIRVRYADWKGWISALDEAPPTGRVTSPAAVAGRLTLAREVLGLGPGKPATLGPFDLLTDVEDRAVLRFLDRIAHHLPEAYRDRFQLDRPATAAEAVVLFAQEDDYRVYESKVRPEAERGALGHADGQLAVLYVGRQSPEEVAAILVHELTHVLNRRNLITPPPPWLEEGMANDLAFGRIDPSGRLQLATLGGRSVVVEEHFYQPGGWLDADRTIHLSGPLGAASLLRRRWQATDPPSLRQLTGLTASTFFDPEDRQLRYDVSTFFVRYLLDSDSEELAKG